MFAKGRSAKENLKAVIDDILGHGNENCMLPGQPEAKNAKHTAKAGGLLFTAAEVEALNELADEVGSARFDAAALPTYEVE